MATPAPWDVVEYLKQEPRVFPQHETLHLKAHKPKPTSCQLLAPGFHLLNGSAQPSGLGYHKTLGMFETEILFLAVWTPP